MAVNINPYAGVAQLLAANNSGFQQNADNLKQALLNPQKRALATEEQLRLKAKQEAELRATNQLYDTNAINQGMLQFQSDNQKEKYDIELDRIKAGINNQNSGTGLNNARTNSIPKELAIKQQQLAQQGLMNQSNMDLNTISGKAKKQQMSAFNENNMLKNRISRANANSIEEQNIEQRVNNESQAEIIKQNKELTTLEIAQRRMENEQAPNNNTIANDLTTANTEATRLDTATKKQQQEHEKKLIGVFGKDSPYVTDDGNGNTTYNMQAIATETGLPIAMVNEAYKNFKDVSGTTAKSAIATRDEERGYKEGQLKEERAHQVKLKTVEKEAEKAKNNYTLSDVTAKALDDDDAALISALGRELSLNGGVHQDPTTGNVMYIDPMEFDTAVYQIFKENNTQVSSFGLSMGKPDVDLQEVMDRVIKNQETRLKR